MIIIATIICLSILGWHFYGNKYWKRWKNQKIKLYTYPKFSRKILKPWGHEEIWAQTDSYVGKFLIINKGESLSKQYHVDKDETLYLLSGCMELEIEKNGDKFTLMMSPGNIYHVVPFTIHRMTAVTACKVLEVSTPELWDVIRLDDKYGRTSK